MDDKVEFKTKEVSWKWEQNTEVIWKWLELSHRWGSKERVRVPHDSHFSISVLIKGIWQGEQIKEGNNVKEIIEVS